MMEIITITIPIIVAILGFYIQRILSQINTKISREKDWSVQWADEFYDSFKKLRDASNNIVFLFYNLSKLNQEGKGNTDEAKSIVEELSKELEKLKKNELNFRIQLTFSVLHGETVQKEVDKLFSLLQDLVKNERGSADEIIETIVHLNKKAKLAHKEILKT